MCNREIMRHMERIRGGVMDTSEAIRVFEDHIDEAGYTCQCKYCKASRLAIEALEMVQAGVVPKELHEKAMEIQYERLRTPQRWIPVSERLPEDGSECLFYYIGFRISGTRHGDRIFSHGCGYRIGSEATHWQPLPEPPGGE